MKRQDIENAILGYIILNPNKSINAINRLQEDDFSSEERQRIFEAVVGLHNADKPIDILTVHKRSGARGFTLARITESVVTSTSLDYYVNKLIEMSHKRNLSDTLLETKEKLDRGDYDIEEATNRLEGAMYKRKRDSVQLKHIKDFNYLERTRRGDSFIKTGFDLDKTLTGLYDSDLVIVGARPSVGKTSFAMSLISKLKDKSVAFFSLEMSLKQIIDRLIAIETSVPLWKIRGQMSKEDLDIVSRKYEELSERNLFIDDSPDMTLPKIRSLARIAKAEYDIDLIIVDYLQLIKSLNKKDTMTYQIAEISRGLKQLAKELDIPVIALSQLSRNVEDGKRKPRLSDLRDSGAIEQDADVVLLMHRDRNKEGSIDFVIAKHRNGATGIRTLAFNPDHTRFDNIYIESVPAQPVVGASNEGGSSQAGML